MEVMIHGIDRPTTQLLSQELHQQDVFEINYSLISQK